jgi:hypothetical protein
MLVIGLSRLEFNVWFRLSELSRAECLNFSNVSENMEVPSSDSDNGGRVTALVLVWCQACVGAEAVTG